LTGLRNFKVARNFLTGTLPKQMIEFPDLSIPDFDKQFCKVCSEGLIPESTTTNFILKGNFSCTDMFNIHYNNNNLLLINKIGELIDELNGNEYLTMDQCASFKKECSISCIEEKKDLIRS